MGTFSTLRPSRSCSLRSPTRRSTVSELCFLKAIFGGWLVALIAWLVAASRDTISQIFFIFSLAFLIPAAGLTHCVAGSSEFLISVFSGKETWVEYLSGFLLPTTLGNIVGGVVLVTLLNYGQVIGSKKKTFLSKVTDRG